MSDYEEYLRSLINDHTPFEGTDNDIVHEDDENESYPELGYDEMTNSYNDYDIEPLDYEIDYEPNVVDNTIDENYSMYAPGDYDLETTEEYNEDCEDCDMYSDTECIDLEYAVNGDIDNIDNIDSVDIIPELPCECTDDVCDNCIEVSNRKYDEGTTFVSRLYANNRDTINAFMFIGASLTVFSVLECTGLFTRAIRYAVL